MRCKYSILFDFRTKFQKKWTVFFIDIICGNKHSLYLPHKYKTKLTEVRKINITNVKALQLFQLIRYGALFLIGILLSNSNFGKTNIGLYESFLLVAGAFTFFWVNGFLKIILPHSSEKSTEQKRLLVFNAFLLLFGFSLVSAILIFTLNKPISLALLNGNEIPMPHILALYVLINSPALMIEYIYLINNCSKSIIIYAVIIFSLQIVAVGLPPFWGYGLPTVIHGLMAVTIVKFVWIIGVLIKYSKINIDFKIIKEYLLVGAPLVLSTLLSSSARYIDGFIITSQFSPEDFAVFQYGARELPLATLLANSLSMAMLPALAKTDIKSPLAELRSEVFRLNVLLFPLSIVLLLTSHWFYPLVFNPQFSQSATIFNVYLLLVVSRLLFPQTLIMAKKINRIIVRASLFEIIINVSLSILFAKLFGIIGVAYATFVAYLFEKIYLAINCKQKLQIKLSEYTPLKIYFIGSSLLIVIFVLVEFIIY